MEQDGGQSPCDTQMTCLTSFCCTHARRRITASILYEGDPRPPGQHLLSLRCGNCCPAEGRHKAEAAAGGRGRAQLRRRPVHAAVHVSATAACYLRHVGAFLIAGGFTKSQKGQAADAHSSALREQCTRCGLRMFGFVCAALSTTCARKSRRMTTQRRCTTATVMCSATTSTSR